MVDIQSKEIIDKISDELKVQPALQIPRKLQDNIQLSYNINPKREVVHFANSLLNATSADIIAAISTTKDTYLISATLNVHKDVVSTSTVVGVVATPKGKAERDLLRLGMLTTTALSETISISYPEPILLEKGTDIRIRSNTAVAAITVGATIAIYETDPQ